MNPYEAVAILAESKVMSPDEIKAAKVLFNWARKQSYRRKRHHEYTKSLELAIERKNKRIKELGGEQ